MGLDGRLVEFFGWQLKLKNVQCGQLLIPLESWKNILSRKETREYTEKFSWDDAHAACMNYSKTLIKINCIARIPNENFISPSYSV